MKICLDAGHFGKYNRSPVLSSYYESDMNWKLHNLLKTELEKYGFDVIVTRANKDKDLDLYYRGRASKGCDLFLSLHSNASTSEVTDYPVAIVQLDGKGDKLGKALADNVRELMGTRQAGQIYKKRGKNGEWYGVLRGASSVGTLGIILEHSFHTNTNAAKWLSNDNNLEALAKSEAKVIAEYFGAEKKTEEKVEKKTDDLYRVRKSWSDAKSQIGAYTSLDNAKAQADKNAGYYVFDSKGIVIYPSPTKSLDDLAKEVIRGLWGGGNNRKIKITDAYNSGKIQYNYSTIQKRVNELLK